MEISERTGPECISTIVFEQLRAEIQTGDTGASSLLEEYNARLYKRGETADLKMSDQLLTTKIVGVSAGGELLTRDQTDRHFKFGEVEWVI